MMGKTYKIVKIISEYKVVVNVGSNDLVHEDQILEVYEPGQDVIDPETGESLGTLDYIKAKLRVVDVFPKMCLCENRDGVLEKTLAQALAPTFTERVPLDVDSKDISGGFEGVSKKIRVGDLVRKRN